MRDTGPWGEAITQLEGKDRAAYAGHLRRLDDDGRHQRFGYLMSDGALDVYAMTVDLDQHILLAVSVDGVIRSTIELCPLRAPTGDCPETKVFCGVIVVEAQWRRKGMGKALLANAIGTVRQAGGTALVIENLNCAKDLRAFAAALSAEFNFAERDCQAWFTLAADCESQQADVASTVPVR